MQDDIGELTDSTISHNFDEAVVLPSAGVQTGPQFRSETIYQIGQANRSSTEKASSDKTKTAVPETRTSPNN